LNIYKSNRPAHNLPVSATFATLNKETP